MSRHLHLILVVWLLVAAGGPSAEPGKEDAAAKDLAKLQGKWMLVAEDFDGKVTRYGMGAVIGFDKEVEIEYDGDGGVAVKSSVKLDPAQSPKAIDLTITFIPIFPRQKGKTLRGIYQLAGDELKMAFPYAPYRERPKEFKTEKGAHFTVVTYKRVKP